MGKIKDIIIDVIVNILVILWMIITLPFILLIVIGARIINKISNMMRKDYPTAKYHKD